MTGLLKSSRTYTKEPVTKQKKKVRHYRVSREIGQTLEEEVPVPWLGQGSERGSGTGKVLRSL